MTWAHHQDAPPPSTGPEADDVLLTRKEASEFLLTLGVQLKPSTLARLWSTGGNGPPCVHHRNRPRYPRGVLRAWAAAQTTPLQRSSSDRAAARRELGTSP